MKISLYTIRRIRRVIIISFVVSVAFSFFYLIETHSTEQLPLVLLLGLFFGIPVGIFEEFIFANKFRRHSLISIMLIKAITYWFSVTVLFGISTFIVSLLVFEVPIGEYIQFLTSGEFIRGTIYILVIYDFVIVFNQYERLLGPGLTFLYAYGKYQTPERENRIFMFLDLKASMQLSEVMERERYFNFINDFFHDISEPVLQCAAEIYQYVGDEVVFTWKSKHGLRNANCLRLYFKIEERIKKQAYKYKSRYNTVPQFKAGLHCGEVIAAVIGDIKKELIYNGEVINTAARIRSTCTELNKNLLASKDLLDKIELNDKLQAEDLGNIQMKGKLESVHLYSITYKKS